MTKQQMKKMKKIKRETIKASVWALDKLFNAMYGIGLMIAVCGFIFVAGEPVEGVPMTWRWMFLHLVTCALITIGGIAISAVGAYLGNITESLLERLNRKRRRAY